MEACSLFQGGLIFSAGPGTFGDPGGGYQEGSQLHEKA